ncbi:MAG: M81 family metallopeptidase [Hyphomicrobiales bacterium]|nr:M81 family metallopeptidase [Hyphomicrobiales bacterium]
MSLRIAIIGLSMEVMIDSPLKTDASAMQIYRRDQIVDNHLWLVRGVLERLAEESDVEVVPLLWATTLPGGLVTHETYVAILQETLDVLAANGPFDGIVVANHGALEVEGLDIQADADYLRAVRRVVGDEVPIAVALDLHGQVSSPLLEAATVISALRTAPHRDDRETGYRAASQLMRVLRNSLRPVSAAVHIPILVSGEAAVTTQQPGAGLYAQLPALDTREGVLEANILVGFAWNDRPWIGMTALVTCEADEQAARRYAAELAETIWQRRNDFVLRMETASLQEGLDRATASPARPVYLSDSGDNTTAGAPGDLTGVLQAVIDRTDLDQVVVAGHTAPKLALRANDLGQGQEIRFVLGEEHISLPGTRKEVVGTIEGCGGALETPGYQAFHSARGAWASIRIGTTLATFHENPIGITTPAHLRAMGIDPTARDVYIVKLGYLHPALDDVAARDILLLTEGVASLDFGGRDWHRIIRPMHPVDGDFAWAPDSALFVSR